jgi:hypothetical protein
METLFPSVMENSIRYLKCVVENFALGSDASSVGKKKKGE